MIPREGGTKEGGRAPLEPLCNWTNGRLRPLRVPWVGAQRGGGRASLSTTEQLDNCHVNRQLHSLEVPREGAPGGGPSRVPAAHERNLLHALHKGLSCAWKCSRVSALLLLLSTAMASRQCTLLFHASLSPCCSVLSGRDGGHVPAA
eukprot:881020-Pelagomonas_calceolata.AAC.9